MGLTMNKILQKFDNCNKFSLTGSAIGYSISSEEFENALAKIENETKENYKIIYEKNKENLKKYPQFDILYEEIKQECYNFDCEENRKFYIEKFYNDNIINDYKRLGRTDAEINKMKDDCFLYSFIADNVGKTTKYGNNNKAFFRQLYHDIAWNFDRQKLKYEFCIKGKNLLEQIPQELKKHFLYYEVSFSNAVTLSSGLMINYYFNLNEETKNYLLKFRNEFHMNLCLDDLTLYKDDKIKFSSCTHEGYNSINFNYENMSKEEIIDFINDEYFEENNDKIIDTIKKLILMNNGDQFSFKDLEIKEEDMICKICNICDRLNLKLILHKGKKINKCENLHQFIGSIYSPEDIYEKNKNSR